MSQEKKEHAYTPKERFEQAMEAGWSLGAISSLRADF